MKINKFKKISNNRYKVYIEDKEYIFYEDIIIKYGLLYKKEISSKDIKEIEKSNNKVSIYNIAINYISFRMRSKKEMIEYLKKKDFNQQEIDEVINKLINQKLLDDNLFSRSYINDKLLLTNYGPNKIRVDLINLGIKEEIVDENLNNIDDNNINEKLNKIIDKELLINNKLPLFKIRNKIINRCINLGYSYDLINDILNTKDINSNSNIELEYNKLYSRYKNKYEGNKLNLFIKNKLFQKGYTIEEINKFVK